MKLLSSMVHTEETSSNIANIYREKTLVGNKIYNIPALHGNSFRGKLRDIGATYMLEKINTKKNSVKLPRYHMLFSGGALEKQDCVLDMNKKKEMRELLPFLSIFGAAIGSEMLRGKLIVSSLLPQCKELDTGERSFNDMVQIVRYTRKDDAKDDVNGYLEEKTGVKTGVKTQMFYETEVLVKGTILEGEILLDSDNEIEIECLNSILKEFNKKPFIGGTSRAGHGKVEFLKIKTQELETEKYNQFLYNNQGRIKNWLEN